MNTTGVTLTLLELFRKIMPEADATKTVASLDELVKTSEEHTNNVVDTRLQHVATKEDIANLRTEIKTEMKDLKIDMIKWMFSLLMGQLGVILGIVYFIIKAMKG